MGSLTDKERISFKDISWLMPQIDVEEILERLDVQVWKTIGDEIWGWCPDHYIFVKRDSSHPKWQINKNTGQTKCWTEGRGSNLLYTAMRLRKDKTPEETLRWMTGNKDGDLDSLYYASMVRRIRKLNEPEKKREPVVALHSMEDEIRDGKMYESGYEYFMRPPGKKPTLIRKETVDFFGVIQMTHGFYANRVVIPVYQKKILLGFCAIDILGEQEWLKRHPIEGENDYRKIRFPKGMQTGEILFGYDGVEPDAETIFLTEGPREVMKLWQEGFPNTLCVLGKNLGARQFELLTQLRPRSITLMFDGDEAGVDGMEKAASERLYRQFADSVYCAIVPKGKDPKNLNGEELQVVIGRARKIS